MSFMQMQFKNSIVTIFKQEKFNKKLSPKIIGNSSHSLSYYNHIAIFQCKLRSSPKFGKAINVLCKLKFELIE